MIDGKEFRAIPPALSRAEREFTDEAALAGLLEQMADELKDQGAVNVEAWQARFPALASEIGRLAPTLQALARLSESGSVPPASGVDDVFHDKTLGDFHIVSELGRGGMGIVYEAEQLSLSRRVALKILPLASVLDARTLQRFKNEALAAAALDHPHIVDVYGVGCERGIHYYAMRLINGCTLADVIAQFREQAARDPAKLPSSLAEVSSVRRTGQSDDLPERDAGAADAALIPTATIAPASTAAGGNSRAVRIYSRAMFRSIAELGIHVAEGLDHAHQQGVIHRDIKPSNLMLDGQGKVWITDFGLARIETSQSLTVTGDLLGTLHYMSPEQTLSNRAPIDHRSDIYSLGATLYELLTLHPVFGDGERAALIQKIAFSEPATPRKLNPQVPADLETIVLKMLEKDPGCRYASARELADDLKRYIDDQPISARRPTAVQRLAKWSLRNKSLVGAIALVSVLTVSIVAATAGWQARDAAAQRRIVEEVATHALESATQFSQQRKWPQALVEIQRAEAAFAGHSGPSQMRREVASRLRDATMVMDLERIRLLAAAISHGEFDFRAADEAYAAAFQRYGIPVLELAPTQAAARLAQQEIKEELADALTNWSIVRQRRPDAIGQDWHHLLLVAAQADPDPWRNRLRAVYLSGGGSADALPELATTANVDNLPPSTLFLLAQAVTLVKNSDERIAAVLRKAQRRHAGDFWINFAVAKYFERIEPPRPDETVRYYSVALGLRPETAAVHSNLGVALSKLGRTDEAIAEFRAAIALQPDFAVAYSNLGHTLRETGRIDEAVAALRAAVRLKDDHSLMRRNLGVALLMQGDHNGAIAEVRKAISLEPKAKGYHYELGAALQAASRLEEAITAFQQELILSPADRESHRKLGAIYESQGKIDEAEAEYRLGIDAERGQVADQVEERNK